MGSISEKIYSRSSADDEKSDQLKKILEKILDLIVNIEKESFADLSTMQEQEKLFYLGRIEKITTLIQQNCPMLRSRASQIAAITKLCLANFKEMSRDQLEATSQRINNFTSAGVNFNLRCIAEHVGVALEEFNQQRRRLQRVTSSPQPIPGQDSGSGAQGRGSWPPSSPRMASPARKRRSAPLPGNNRHAVSLHKGRGKTSPPPQTRQQQRSPYVSPQRSRAPTRTGPPPQTRQQQHSQQTRQQQRSQQTRQQQRSPYVSPQRSRAPTRTVQTSGFWSTLFSGVATALLGPPPSSSAARSGSASAPPSPSPSRTLRSPSE